MAARKIKLKDQLGRVVRVSTATTPAAPATPTVTQPETARPTATVWKLIREIPANIQKLAKLAGTGFTTRGANGEWYQRSIAQGEGIAVTNAEGVAGNPTIGLAELANAGGGALQKTLRDKFGRLAGTSAATTADLTEGTNLYYTDARADARAAAAVADHVAELDPHSQYTTSAEAAAAAPVQSVNGMTGNVVISAAVPKGYIDGLRLEWLSSSSIRVGSGAAFIPSAATALELPAAVTKAGLSLTANTWHHVYLYSNAGAADVEVSATAPDTPYSGTARAKAGDPSRRYLGSIRAATGGAIIQFQHDVASGAVTYLGGEYSLRNILSGGKATVATNVSVANLAPVTAIAVDILCTNGSTSGTAISGNSEQALPLAAGAGNSYFGYFDASGGVGVPGHPIDVSRAFQYRFLSTPTGAGLYIDLNGYRFFR